MSDWSFYRVSDGVLADRIYSGSADHLDANTPPGHAALSGRHDHLRVRMDMSSKQLVAYKPPQPIEHQFCTWQWSDESWQWIAVATDAAHAFEIRAERDRRLAACDWVVVRSVEHGEDVPAAWSAYRSALRNISQQTGFPHAIDWPDIPV